MPVTHGTLGGHSWHRRRKEQPCAACRKAKKKYDHEYIRQESRRRRRRAEEKARDAAHRVLRTKYREEFWTIYHKVLAELMAAIEEDGN